MSWTTKGTPGSTGDPIVHELRDGSGAVIDTLRHDWETNQYRDGRGIPVGQKWETAKRAMEARKR